MQGELDVRSQDLIRKESQVSVALEERDFAMEKLRKQEGKRVLWFYQTHFKTFSYFCIKANFFSF